MDNLFGEIDCRSKSDGIVMGILRSAMDKAHEKVQSEDGSIKFLHERSTFYELAVILVESGLSIVQQETKILESNREKVISDLNEMRHWLLGRIKEMKHLINKKDRELTEMTENELKLRQVLESKEREVIFLRHNLENQRTMSEGSLDFGLLLKNKAKLEGETTDSKSDSELLNEKRFGEEDFYGSYHHIPKINPTTDSLSPEQNNVIQQMSSDIDILKETLDFAFGKRNNGEMVPLENKWRCTIEIDTLSVLIRGFIKDIKQRFEDTLKESLEVLFGRNVEMVILEKQLRCIIEKDILYVSIRGFINDIQQRFVSKLRDSLGDQIPHEFSNENLAEFISEIIMLYQKLDGFYSGYDYEYETIGNQVFLCPLAKIRRSCSEPMTKVNQEDQEVRGHNYVTKQIRNHEFVIRKGLEDQNCMKKEVLSGEKSALTKKDKKLVFLNIIEDFIARLDDISSVSVKSVNTENAAVSVITDKVITSECDCEILKDEVEFLKEELYNLNLQTPILDEIYLILLEGLFNDQELACFEPIERNTTLLLGHAENGNSKIFVKDFKNGSTLQETIGSLLKEEVYKEIFKAWKEERDDFNMEVHIREDLYKFMIVEAVKDVNTEISEYLKTAYRKVEVDGNEESLIQKLDSMLKCLNSDEDIMVKESSETEEHYEQEILEYEWVEERKTIEWSLYDDESTFTSMNEKLEIAMKQLSKSKELLCDLDKSIGISHDKLAKNGDGCVYTNTSLVAEIEKPPHESFVLINPSYLLMSTQVSDFHQMIKEFEVNIVQNLDLKASRIEELKHHFHNLIEPVDLMKKKKLLYKKAFLSRSQNLRLAETEVDLLGDQVEELLHLLKNIYMILEQNSTILSCHFQVFDVLKLIKDELADGVSCTSSY